MTPRTSRFVDFAVNAIVTLVAGAALVIFSGAWSLKEDKADHNTDLITVNAKLDRILDAICDPVKEKPRACGDVHP